MKVLVIPDVHLKPKMLYRASAIMRQGKADRAVLINCRREMMVEVLQLLNRETYVFTTKLEMDDADIDGSELFKIIRKEAQSYLKRTGNNPFMM